MNPATGQGRGLRLDRDALGRAQSWAVTHRGLQYQGEVIVAEAVNPEWGEPLEGDLCFRIVLYTVPRRIPAGQIRDPRIAMAVPRRSADPTRESLGRELQAIHEAKARYVTGSDPESLAVRSSIEEREASLMGELTRRESRIYAQGRIYSQTGVTLKPLEIFVEETPDSWVDRMVDAVYLGAYPDLPFEYGEFPETLTADGIVTFLRGVFQEHSDAEAAVSRLGPALRMTSSEAPHIFDVAACLLMDVIGDTLESRGGEMPAQELLGTLCRGHGLNRGLATMYLLAFVHHTHAEVKLNQGHEVRLRQGGRFPGDRVGWDTVTDIEYTVQLKDQLGTLRARPPVEWNTVLPYATLLVDGLRPATDDGQIEEQDRLLLDALARLGDRIERHREAVGELGAASEEGVEAVAAALHRLQRLSAASGYRGLYEIASNSFAGASALSEALDLSDRLERLSTLVPEITRTRRYLDEMSFGREHQELALRRDAVAARTGTDSLMADPSLWNSVQDSFQQLRRECVSVYLSHHARYHAQAAELGAELEAAGPQVDALVRFNEVPDLGGTLGDDIPERHRLLTSSVRSCTTLEDNVSLEDAPVCPSCLLPLSEEIPQRQATLLLSDLARAMREYNRRISSEGVRRILADPTKEQLEKFINMVQVSDLSTLSNVLDDEVVSFLQTFLRPV